MGNSYSPPAPESALSVVPYIQSISQNPGSPLSLRSVHCCFLKLKQRKANSMSSFHQELEGSIKAKNSVTEDHLERECRVDWALVIFPPVNKREASNEANF